MKNLYRYLKRHFDRGEKSGVDEDYLRRWSKKPIRDKFTMLQSFWEFGEESKKIHRREALKKKRLTKNTK